MPSTTHPRPTPPDGWDRVPSGLVTRAMLRSWGFEVAACSASHESHKGEEFGKAAHAAWCLGWTVLDTKTRAALVPKGGGVEMVAPLVAELDALGLVRR